MNNLKTYNNLLLGLGLGLGYLTDLRFIKYIGLSEIIILLTIISLNIQIKRNYTSSKIIDKIIISYFNFVFFVQLPIVTMIVWINSDLVSAPVYVISFAMGFYLFKTLLASYCEELVNMKTVTNVYFYTFLISNIILIIYNPEYLNAYRFKGGAHNPNQLMFYASSISFMIFLYKIPFRWIKFLLLILVTLRAKSDAYNVIIFSTIFLSVYYPLFMKNKLPFSLNLVTLCLFSILIFFLVSKYYSPQIIELWNNSDQGGSRIKLLLNGLKISSYSPIIGWGAGSFSGEITALEGAEAHSSFIDLSSQFGFITPTIIYSISFLYILHNLKKKEYLTAAFASSYLVAGFFHFNARHFFFWVELSIFYYHLMNNSFLNISSPLHLGNNSIKNPVKA